MAADHALLPSGAVDPHYRLVTSADPVFQGPDLFRVLDHRAVAIVMAVVTLIFVGLWLLSDPKVTIRPRSTPKAVAAGLASGVTILVAHSGGPPLAMYLLPLG